MHTDYRLQACQLTLIFCYYIGTPLFTRPVTSSLHADICTYTELFWRRCKSQEKPYCNLYGESIKSLPGACVVDSAATGTRCHWSSGSILASDFTYNIQLLFTRHCYGRLQVNIVIWTTLLYVSEFINFLDHFREFNDLQILHFSSLPSRLSSNDV